MSEPNGTKILTNNRRARHLYHLSDHLETGMVLTGSEVKSAREGKIQLADAYGTLRGRELWLVNAHISRTGRPIARTTIPSVRGSSLPTAVRSTGSGSRHARKD